MLGNQNFQVLKTDHAPDDKNTEDKDSNSKADFANCCRQGIEAHLQRCLLVIFLADICHQSSPLGPHAYCRYLQLFLILNHIKPFHAFIPLFLELFYFHELGKKRKKSFCSPSCSTLKKFSSFLLLLAWLRKL
jgi:hypothetical protein